MRWFKPNLRSSVSAMFSSGHPSQPAESALEDVGIEDIRTSMLALIGEIEEQKFLHVGRRIRYASEVMALWYLRGDLMALLASRHGEVRARENLKEITGRFADMLPKGLRSRPSPLAARDGSNSGNDEHIE
jgi:hypothetical protein